MMESHFLYLFLNLLTISFPLAFSFYPKANFSRKWKYLAPAVVIPAVGFIAWDEWFTRMGVWGFNPRYLTGVYIGQLPLEEVLFFVCIPYACVFTYEAVNYLLAGRDPLARYEKTLTILLISVLSVVGILSYQRWYPAVTFPALALTLTFVRFRLGSQFLSRFYFAYLIILIPFFGINGVLTGTGIDGEVVWYNNLETLGMRMETIPAEDTFYGMLLILMNTSLFETFQVRQLTRNT